VAIQISNILVDNGCNIWNGDAYKNYEKWWDNVSKTTFEVPKKFTEEELVQAIKLDEFHAERYGDLGPIYGKQWRAWSFPEVNGYFGPIDQIKILVQSLKTNPDSRRLMVNAWNVGELHEMTLPPCHYGFQVYTRELSLEERYVMYFEKLDHTMVPLDIKIPNIHQYFTGLNIIPTRAISLMWNQRSVDTPLGLPFNIASYALLLELLAMEVNMIPDQLIGNLGDCHIYLNQTDGVKEQLTRSPLPLGKLVINDEFWNPDVSI
jgi:thymidylate synthase